MASMKEKAPATNPLMMPMDSGSRAEMLRVKLLSTPQRMQANKMPSAPTDMPNWVPLKVKIALATVIQPMASQMRLPMNSWNKKAASSVVATHSKFNNSEAVAAGVLLRPSISMMGA